MTKGARPEYPAREEKCLPPKNMCQECGGTGFLRKTKLDTGQTVYISGANVFDNDTKGNHKGSINVKCLACRGTGRAEDIRSQELLETEKW